MNFSAYIYRHQNKKIYRNHFFKFYYLISNLIISNSNTKAVTKLNEKYILNNVYDFDKHVIKNY